MLNVDSAVIINSLWPLSNPPLEKKPEKKPEKSPGVWSVSLWKTKGRNSKIP
jgi:hypothetical protein